MNIYCAVCVVRLLCHLTLKNHLSLILPSRHLPMSLSTEAIISIVGVLTNLPPALLILWKIYKWKWAQDCDTSGMCETH
jgi:hypothetical protein